MRSPAGGAALLALLAMSGAAAAATREAPVVLVEGPAGSGPLVDLTPSFILRGVGFAEHERPLRLGLQVARGGSFLDGLIVDTTVLADSVATIALTRPLPANADIVWRARAISSAGHVTLSAPSDPRPVSAWVRLVAPDAATGAVVETRRPRFTWVSARTATPPGPWRYDLRVYGQGTGRTAFEARDLSDTTYVAPVDLESNTPYRWEVSARLATGDSVLVASAGSFVVLATGLPATTVLYQNFPNPFPTSSASATCVWFDVAVPTHVRLEIFDLQWRLVRRLIDEWMPAGRYGRGASPAGGCDPRHSWDGTGDHDRSVPSGVYLVRLQAGGDQSVRKILYRGG